MSVNYSTKPCTLYEQIKQRNASTTVVTNVYSLIRSLILMYDCVMVAIMVMTDAVKFIL